MRTLLLTALYLLPASLAHAGIDFRCEPVKAEEQLVGWLRFGFSGGSGRIQLDHWNGYPPITLVDAELDGGKPLPSQDTRFESAPDRHEGTVAVVEVPASFLKLDRFLAKVTLRYKAPRAGGKAKAPSAHLLSCVRQ